MVGIEPIKFGEKRKEDNATRKVRARSKNATG
jgi:hypothetical protein